MEWFIYIEYYHMTSTITSVFFTIENDLWKLIWNFIWENLLFGSLGHVVFILMSLSTAARIPHDCSITTTFDFTPISSLEHTSTDPRFIHIKNLPRSAAYIFLMFFSEEIHEYSPFQMKISILLPRNIRNSSTRSQDYFLS